MQKQEFDATFVICLVTITGCIVLLMLGIDSDIKAIIGAVLGYYFGAQVPIKADRAKR